MTARRLLRRLASLALTLLAGCAEHGRTLNIYNWSDYIGKTTLEDFTKQTGIEIRYDVYDSDDVLEAKLLAGNSGYDVVVPSAWPYFARQVEAGIYRKLDARAIPNLRNLDPDLMARVAAADPGNEHGVIYAYGTNGIGYNVSEIERRMPSAPVDSWDMLFKPEIVARFADCGVTMLDSATDVIPLALNYLGKDPNSEDPTDLSAAERLLSSIRPYVKYFHSSQYINDLASGEVCLSLGWSGDVIQAKNRAEEALPPRAIAYSIPKEGSLLWFDMLAIPKDAPHPAAANAFINYVLDPKVMAGITEEVGYANAVPGSLRYVSEKLRDDTAVFPTRQTRDRLFVSKVLSPEAERERNRAWAHVRSGE